MSRRVKIVLTVISVIAAAVCVMCSLYMYQYFRGNRFHSSTGQAVRVTEEVAPQPEPNEPPVDEGSEPSLPTEPEPEEPPEEVPTQEMPTEEEPTEESPAAVSASIDFDALWEINEEVYAWVEVPGTNISYAVLQSAKNDLYYNNHNLDGSYFSGGSIYSQRYNSKDFTDSMTVLYGHDIKAGTMFSQLNDFSDPECFEANRFIYIYTPEKVFVYEIFAAYPHSEEHLLLCYDFGGETQFCGFFDGLTAEDDAHYRRDLFPEFGERVLTLSTCYRRNHSVRYLVQGVLTGEYDVVN